ncbi:MAG: hypothetical protein ACTHL8_09705 [Burkholderiaceae bacterium]
MALLALVAGAVALSRRPAPPPRPVVAESRAFLGFDPARDSQEPDAPVAPAVAAPVAPPVRTEGEVDLCGVGLVRTSADDPDGSGHISPAQRADAARRLDAALAAAPDPRARAAGLLLRLDTLRDPMPDEASDDAAGAAAATLAELAGAAAASDDPAVVAAALAACLRAPGAPPAACGALDANRWASLEPANAAPWLRLAQAARDAGDDAALAAAVYQASVARRLDWHAEALALAALQAIPADASPLARTLDAHAIARAREGWAAPAYGGLAAFCAPGTDANRDQVCAAAATLLLRPAASMAELRLGARLGRSLGWPAARLEDLRLQREALARADADTPPDPRAWDCASADRLQRQAALRERLGDGAARRALLVAEGHDLAGDVARLRTLRAQRLARLESAGPDMP